jgi:hypothetical protein
MDRVSSLNCDYAVIRVIANVSRSVEVGGKGGSCQLTDTKIEWLTTREGTEERSKKKFRPVTGQSDCKGVTDSVQQFIADNKLDELCTYGLSAIGRKGVTYKCVIDRRERRQVLFTITGGGKEGLREWIEFDDEEKILNAVRDVIDKLLSRVAASV